MQVNIIIQIILKLSKREKTEITSIKNERENITDLMDIRKT